MITILQGTMGSGKSATCTSMAFEHLKRGGVVATNFDFVDGWAYELAGHSFVGKFFPDKRLENAHCHFNRHFFVDSLSAITSIDPRSLAVRELKHDPNKYSEGQGLLILDECQLMFNSRKWQGNMGWIEFFTQSRKRGWDILLVAHSIDMVDSQIRPLIEFEARFRNLQKIRVPIIGVPLSPIPAFAIVYRYAGLGPGASNVVKKDLAPLPLWAARLYDSMQVFSADQWLTGNTQWRRSGNPPPPLGGGGGTNPPLELTTRRSTLSPDCLWSRWASENQ